VALVAEQVVLRPERRLNDPGELPLVVDDKNTH
jgi:hypothetical protein